MAKGFQTLPGFRDFYPDDCAARNYVFDRWRAVAHRYGFVEYEAPVLEPTDLYRRKSGDEIVHQLFCFTDKGERDVAMRPELTPSLARMVAARQREFKKPLKWFSIGQFFRYEKQQKGRGREFYQFNCDILGEGSPAADAELIALSIDLMRDLGFTAEDFRIRLSDRRVWHDFVQLKENRFFPGEPIRDLDLTDSVASLLQVIDKWGRTPKEKLVSALEEIGHSYDEVEAFMKRSERSPQGSFLWPITDELSARGMADFVQIDLGIVRGLAYYTGPVFEVFDFGKGMRAVAGGGRYDSLVNLIGGVDLPACGFAMGDMVITDLIRETPGPNERLEVAVKSGRALDGYVVIADEGSRAHALAIMQDLRTAGHRIGFPLVEAKVARQFQSAEEQGARWAVIVGSEYPSVSIKDLIRREERPSNRDQLIGDLGSI